VIGLIVAVSPEGVIGLHGKIPWRHPGDLKRFKRLTTGATVIMGRNTWESIGKPLPNRRNIVITQTPIEARGVDCFPTIDDALATTEGDVWFIGGARIYQEAMRQHAELLDITYVPESISDPAAVKLPEIDPEKWIAGPLIDHEDDPTLKRREYRRKAQVSPESGPRQ
jgi:dihydrofolate reductase